MFNFHVRSVVMVGSMVRITFRDLSVAIFGSVDKDTWELANYYAL